MKAIAASSLVLLSACSQAVPSGGASSASSTTPTSSTPTTSASGSSTPGGGAVFDVHEWGLVDVAGPNARVLAGPPSGPTNWNAPRRKPVLYFHLADGTKTVDAKVRVRAAAPGIVEHFPAGKLSEDHTTLEWTQVSLRAGNCPVGTIPKRDAPECKTSDGICEVAELARYETNDSSCVRTDAGDFNHLFYRSLGPAPPLPFDVTPKGTSLVIKHTRAADFVGSIIWVRNEGGAVVLSILSAPALGAELEAARPKGTDVAAAQKALDASMRETGLTEAEVQAFDRAWSNDLFGRTGPAREAPARRAAIAPQDYLLFALPSSLMNGASELLITPAPRAVKRFMLVRLTV